MIKHFLDQASAAYYRGSPIITDEEFDYLAAQHKYEQLGDPEPGEAKHWKRMYSLQKVHYGEEGPVYDDRISTPKLDGAAISILYVGGGLHKIITRGNGIVGQDITDKVSHLVPLAIVTAYTMVQVNAEVVAPKYIPNARNYAAGALNLKDLEEIRKRELTVIAYEALGIDAPTYLLNLEWLENRGIMTVTTYWLTDKFPTDGEVVRENSYKIYNEAGFTAKHPRAAYALKPAPTVVTTKLLDVEWQLGRTGVVTPVAILEPVMIGDATISRATLNNMDYIEALDLEIGCTVELVRSGEIIPKIIRKVA